LRQGVRRGRRRVDARPAHLRRGPPLVPQLGRRRRSQAPVHRDRGRDSADARRQGVGADRGGLTMRGVRSARRVLLWLLVALVAAAGYPGAVLSSLDALTQSTPPQQPGPGPLPWLHVEHPGGADIT